MTIDKATLLKNRLPQAEVEIEGVGTVKVRGLSRVEAMEINRLNDVEDVSERVVAIERAMLRFGLVEPKLTDDEVRQLQEISPANELNLVTEKIGELSGIDKGAAKRAYEEFEADQAAEFRVLSSGAAVNDSEPAPNRRARRAK